jgi:hypothetical protein
VDLREKGEDLPEKGSLGNVTGQPKECHKGTQREHIRRCRLVSAIREGSEVIHRFTEKVMKKMSDQPVSASELGLLGTVEGVPPLNKTKWS